MASILNKAGACGSVIRANVNAIPIYSHVDRLKEIKLRTKPILDSSRSIVSSKITRRSLNLWCSSVSVGISAPLHVRLIHTDVLKVPDFTEYRAKQTVKPYVKSEESDIDRRLLSYGMLFSGSVVATVMAKNVVRSMVEYLMPSAKAIAEATVEIDISKIPEGKQAVFKWRNKPLFVKHRSPEEIETEAATPLSELRDPQKDSDRVQRPEWLIVVGICTHLGCVPIANAGDFPGGYYCPCHGSHYDGSGRIRAGPAPENLEVPEYHFTSDTTVIVG